MTTQTTHETLRDAMAKHGMERAGTLADIAQNPDGYSIWLGGFSRFAKVRCVNADWWVTEGSGLHTSSWCCTPDTPVYRAKAASTTREVWVVWDAGQRLGEFDTYTEACQFCKRHNRMYAITSILQTVPATKQFTPETR